MTQPVPMEKKFKCWKLFVLLWIGLFVSFGIEIPVAKSEIHTHIALSSRLVEVTVIGDDLYGISNSGVEHINLREGSRKQLVSNFDLEDQYGILEGYGYFVSNGQLYIIDPVNRTIGRWQDGVLHHVIDIPGHLALFEEFTECLSTQGMLWVTGQDGIYVLNLDNGKHVTTLADKIISYQSYPDGMLVLRQIGEDRQLQLYDSNGLKMRELVILPANNLERFGVDYHNGQIYAPMDGMVCRLVGHQWKPLRTSIYWEAIWNGHMVVPDGSGLTLLPLTEMDDRKLTIIGGNGGIYGDREFMLAHPGFGLQRIEKRTTAEDVYKSILNQDDTVDLFCLRMGYGVKTLIDKGFASSVGLESMKSDVERMHPYLQQVITREDKLYAYPLFVRSIQSWWRMKDEEHLSMPKTVLELLESSQDWEKHENSSPFVRDEFYQTAWTRRDFAQYVLIQWIMGNDGDSVRFMDKRLESILLKILEMPDHEQVDALDLDTPTVIMHSWNPMLLSEYLPQMDLESGPEAVDGWGCVYRADLTVYLVNPYSQKQQEIETYLAYISANRLPYQIPWIYKDVVATQSERYKEDIERLIQEEQQVRDAIVRAKPEEVRDLEDELSLILAEQDSYRDANIRWDYHPKNLAFFQTHYVPQIRLPVSPLLSTEEGIFPGLWPNVSDLLDQYLAGQLSPWDCLVCMDDLWQLYQREGE